MRNTIQRVSVGDRFGRLVVLEESRSTTSKIKIKVHCDCGIECEVIEYSLISGNTTSCGCRRRESITKHGNCPRSGKSAAYTSYGCMIQRCTNANNIAFSDYGGRGIKICEHWMESFENFLTDMGPCPKDRTIHRINNDGNYEPSNCRWATMAEQAEEKRGLRLVTYNGETKTISSWARKLGIKRNTLDARLQKWGDVEKAFTARTNTFRTKQKESARSRMIEYSGKRQCLADWAKELGIGFTTLCGRLNTGWTVEEALSTPRAKKDRRHLKSGLHLIEVDGAMITLKECSRRLGIGYGAMKNRVRQYGHNWEILKMPSGFRLSKERRESIVKG